MRYSTENIRFLRKGEILEAAATGVSLHCHTLHSKELLDFVPYYAERIPVASYFWRQMKRLGNERPDFQSGYWEPPLTGREVFGSEAKNMAALGLNSIVSITDHDSIDANLGLRESIDASKVPVSLEWTVPFENAFFHIGVHNLPFDRAREITNDLLDYTRAPGYPDKFRLCELFKMLDELTGVLVVFNHPVWDIEMIGQRDHEKALKRFLAIHLKWIHAVEINGFRSWVENQEVIKLAASVGLPLISGGDRHCCQANTMINFTDAVSFDEFVSEIRVDRRSRLAVTPAYHVPLPARQVRSIAQILANYKHLPDGRKAWSDRVFLDYRDGRGLRTLTQHWNGKRPAWTYAAFFALGLLAHPILEPLIALTVGDNDIGREDRSDRDQAIPIDAALMPGG